MFCCSFCIINSIPFFSSSDNHFASDGLSFTRYHQKNAHIMAGTPSNINIHRQPSELTRYPDTTDIHKMVTGLPRIKNVFALDRSDFVNHLLSKITIEGITALSTTPSIKRITIKTFTLLVIPVAIAHTPHKINDQKINRLVLFVAA